MKPDLEVVLERTIRSETKLAVAQRTAVPYPIIGA